MMRKEWKLNKDMVPIVAAPGIIGWGTINSVRAERNATMRVAGEDE